MNTDDLLAACERVNQSATPGPWGVCKPTEHNRYRGSGHEICATEDSSHAGTGVGFIYGATDADCVANAEIIALARSALPLLVARVRELDNLDHRIKIAFAEMYIALSAKGLDGVGVRNEVGYVLTKERFLDGEVSESLLGEMQALTASMKGGGDGR